jgi:hypothetical protein
MLPEAPVSLSLGKIVQPQTGRLTSLFTDIVSSTPLKQHLAGAARVSTPHASNAPCISKQPGSICEPFVKLIVSPAESKSSAEARFLCLR